MWPRLSPHSKALAYVALCPLLYQHRYRLLFPLRAALSPSCSWAEPLWAGPLVASVSASVSAPRYRVQPHCLWALPLGAGRLVRWRTRPRPWFGWHGLPSRAGAIRKAVGEPRRPRLPLRCRAIAPLFPALCVAMLSARPPGGACYEFEKCGAVCNFSLTRVVPILPKYHLWEFTRLGQTENCKIVFVQQTS